MKKSVVTSLELDLFEHQKQQQTNIARATQPILSRGELVSFNSTLDYKLSINRN
jgi:hypothetical protein